MKKYYLSFAAIIISTTIFNQREASAQIGTSLIVSPAVIEVVVKPGQIKNNTITVTNRGSSAIGVGVSINEITPKEIEGLSIDLPKPDWITVSPTEMLLAPNESKEVAIITSPNKKTSPGGYYAIIYFQAALPLSDIKLGATTSIPKVGAFALISVGGNSNNKQFQKVTEINYPNIISQNIPEETFILKNTGDVHFLPSGSIEFKKVLGKKIYKAKLPPVLIMPSTSREVSIGEVKNISPGLYKVQGILDYTSSGKFTSEKLGYVLVTGNSKIYVFATTGIIIMLLCILLFTNRNRLKPAVKALLKRETKNP